MERMFSTPAETAKGLLDVGKAKGNLSGTNMILLGILAGVYIALAAQLATIATNDMGALYGDGLTRVVMGVTFTLGLMLVVIAGAELWTGNNLMVPAAYTGVISWGQLLKNWLLVYFSNFLGSLLMVWLMAASGLWQANGGAVGARALGIALGKVEISFGAAVARGILCNMLVTLAVIFALAAKDIAGKLWGMFFPIAAFVTSGFEHSIANMYFVPAGIMLTGDAKIVELLGRDVSGLTWGSFIANNLIPVTLGNLIGGAVIVATGYYLIYIKPSQTKQTPAGIGMR
ncbi:MAG: formate/nitrite transporter family protein [Firmicutes bacterium]|nr:formate/nitrite transporter family protein [Bacillota bacterium]